MRIHMHMYTASTPADTDRQIMILFIRTGLMAIYVVWILSLFSLLSVPFHKVGMNCIFLRSLQSHKQKYHYSLFVSYNSLLPPFCRCDTWEQEMDWNGFYVHILTRYWLFCKHNNKLSFIFDDAPLHGEDIINDCWYLLCLRCFFKSAVGVRWNFFLGLQRFNWLKSGRFWLWMWTV